MSYNKLNIAVQEVKRSLKSKNMEKKLDSYRNKLIGALVANDRDRFMEIMLQLSSYTQVDFDFIHWLIVDFDKNKNIAFDFVRQLNNFSNNKEVKNEK